MRLLRLAVPEGSVARRWFETSALGFVQRWQRPASSLNYQHPFGASPELPALQRSAVAHFLSLEKGLPPSPLGYIFTFDDTAIQRGRFHTLLLFSTHNVLTSPLLGPTLPNPKVTCPMSLIS